jgi:myo-inositol-1(or 4)-monophosphatase
MRTLCIPVEYAAPMHPMLNIAVRAARRAGSIINRAALGGDALVVKAKRANDFVTQVDRAAEEAIIEIVRKAYPDHGFLAEESGATSKDAEYRWIIDPLDGTTNFIHGFPQYGISIGIAHRGALAHAVVYDPVKNELFTASRGRGAFLNDRRVRVSKCTRLQEALIGTGFPCGTFWGHGGETFGYQTFTDTSSDGNRQVVIAINADETTRTPRADNAVQRLHAIALCG